MKKLILCLAFLMLAATPAHADLDQTCLRQCLSTTSSPSSCMTQCSYNIPPVSPPQPSAAQQPLANGHDVTPTLTPAGNTVVLPPAQPATPPASKDFACFNSCLHDAHNSYGWCEEHCAKAICPSQAVMCTSNKQVNALSPQTAPVGSAQQAYKPPAAPTR